MNKLPLVKNVFSFLALFIFLWLGFSYFMEGQITQGLLALILSQLISIEQSLTK